MSTKSAVVLRVVRFTSKDNTGVPSSEEFGVGLNSLLIASLGSLRNNLNLRRDSFSLQGPDEVPDDDENQAEEEETEFEEHDPEEETE